MNPHIRAAAALAIAALALPIRAHVGAQTATPAAPPPTLQQLDPGRTQPPSRMEQARNADARATQDRQTQCLRAFGHPAFCGCLGEQLPADTAFLTYIQIVASTREELGYSRLSKADQQNVDRVSAARDGCVAKAFSGR